MTIRLTGGASVDVDDRYVGEFKDIWDKPCKMLVEKHNKNASKK